MNWPLRYSSQLAGVPKRAKCGTVRTQTLKTPNSIRKKISSDQYFLDTSSNSSNIFNAK